MTEQTKSVLIVGATGYLGRHLIRAYHVSGYKVHALARDAAKLKPFAGLLESVRIAQPTQPETMVGVCDGIDVVISTLGITRQRDGLSYMDVDYQANMNVLDEALRAGVEKFGFVHVLNAEQMPNVDVAVAKAKFAAALDAAPIDSTVICPSGFFSDLEEILTLAEKDRVFLFGDGESLITPIHGRDLAQVCVAAVESQETWVTVGGPETFSQNEIAELAFEALGRKPRISYIPFWIVRAIIGSAKALGFRSQVGVLDLFVTTSAMDMTAPHHGTRTLAETYENKLRERHDPFTAFTDEAASPVT